jgi:hypothetical protein
MQKGYMGTFIVLDTIHAKVEKCSRIAPNLRGTLMGFFNSKKVFDRKWTAGDEEHDEALTEAGVAVEAASRVKGRPTGWLVQDVVPDAAVTLVAGEPGAGKTFLACQLAADAARELKTRVLLATAGYESAELLRWRLDRAEGDSRRVALATLTPRGYTDRRQNPSEHFELFEAVLSS